MLNYFTTAEPLNKNKIITLFHTVSHVTQLFVAPFGLSEDIDLILGENVSNLDYKLIYKSWEDSLSRRLYSIHNMPEDRIAASMQLYVEKQNDPEIIRAMRRNESISSEILRPSSVIELPIESNVELAIIALKSVLFAFEKANQDFLTGLKSFPNIKPEQIQSINSSDINFIASTLSQETLEIIISCLSSLELSDEKKTIVNLTYEQYIALIDAYQTDEQIQSIFLSLLSNNQKEFVLKHHIPVLKFIRCVGTENLLLNTIFCHPIVATLFHLGKEIQSNNENNQELADSNKKEEVYYTSFKFLDTYNSIQQLKQSSASNLFGPAPIEEDEGDTLQISCILDEIFGKSERNEDHIIYQQNEIPVRLKSLLLVERALCHNVLQELDEALSDAKAAISLDPKNSAARKCRYKIYRNMANEAASHEGDNSETDELDENGASSDDERGNRPSLKRLLIKGAFDALAAFVLGGSSNLILAGEAEDAAREACREDAKAYFWKRHNGDNGDDDDECTDEDIENNKEIIDDNQNTSQISINEGDISSLCKCTGNNKCDNRYCGIYASLIQSSCIPKRWMISAFQSLYAPIHTALDIPLPAPITQVSNYEDGLGEDPTPFEHIVSNSKVQDEETENFYPDQPEGDDDAFRLICRVANALSRGCDGTDSSVNIEELEQLFASQSLTNLNEIETQNEGIIKLSVNKNKIENTHIHTQSHTHENLILINEVNNPEDLVYDLLYGQNINNIDELQIQVQGTLPNNQINNQKIISNENNINNQLDETKLNEWDCSSIDFLEAFDLVTSPLAHELTGVNFVWKDIGSFNPSKFSSLRFRISAGLTTAMQDAICDRSMHNSMHNVESYESEDSDASSNDDDGDGDGDEESLLIEEKKIRKVSRQLRARLLSLCGSIAYLLGDSMGGYQCMKASILLEGESLDSRLKIATMLMEMDELDKAEVHLSDAKRKWPNEIVVDLHEAELSLHQTDYMNAVEILRKVSEKFHQSLFSSYSTIELTSSQRDLMNHLGPSIISLHGVAEFRVNPENPEYALSVLKKGIEKYPRSTSLLVCYGEVLSQAGDPSGALKLYYKASKLEPGHPMPYLNASRVYQQLNQSELAKLHMMKALSIDDSLSLTLVDIAQYKIQQRKKYPIINNKEKTSESNENNRINQIIEEMTVEEILDYGLYQARHVSEILDILTTKQIAEFYNKLFEKELVLSHF